jgi:hypothetical protein
VRAVNSDHRLSATAWLLWLVAVFVASLLAGWWLVWHVLSL